MVLVLVLNLKLSEMSSHLMWIELDLLTVHFRKIDAWSVLSKLHAINWLNPSNFNGLFFYLLLSRLLRLIL